MAEDIFIWPMSAETSKPSVDMLREEIIAAHQAQPQKPVPISLLFAFLPVESDEKDAAIARGNFVFSGDRWENRADEPLEVVFSDPVMKEYTIEFPAIFAGSVEVTGDKVNIVLDPPLAMEVPRLAELGVDRSKFQKLIRIDAAPDQSLTILREADGAKRETWIQVRLIADAGVAAKAFLEVSGVQLMASSGDDSCGKDKDDPNWYVYQRRSDHLCFTHHGTIITGGQVAYDKRYGPATYDACIEWENKYCQI